MIKFYAKIALFFSCHKDALELEVDAAQSMTNVSELEVMRVKTAEDIAKLEKQLEADKDATEYEIRKKCKEARSEIDRLKSMNADIATSIQNYKMSATQRRQRAADLREKAKTIIKF